MVGIIFVGVVLTWLGWATSTRSQNMFGRLMMTAGIGTIFLLAPMAGCEVLRAALGRRAGTFDGERFDNLSTLQLAVWAGLWVIPALYMFVRSRRQHGNVFDSSGMGNLACMFVLWFVLGVALQPLYRSCPPYDIACHRAVAEIAGLER
jgi:hypothetical protein